MASTESTVSVTVKTANGSLVTLRADNPSEFVNLVLSAQADNLFGPAVYDFEAMVRTDASVVQAAVANIGGTVVEQSSPAFAPVAPPTAQATIAGQRTCAHGAMTYREGSSAKGPWKGYFCPAPNKADQCKPQWVK